MNKEKLTVNREVAKRMILKNMDLEYIKEITDLSKKQIRSLNNISKSFIGENDYALRKEYASLHHLHFKYYFEDKTRFYTGVDLNKSDFYKNKYIQFSNRNLNENIEKMEKYYANILRMKAMLRISQHIEDYNDLMNACKVIYSWPEGSISNCDIYLYIKYKIKEREEKKMIINLLTVEENLKKIAFICNVKDEFVEDIKKNNSMFFKNNKLNLKKFNDEKLKWEDELKYEIAKRVSYHSPSVEKSSAIFNIERQELEKISENTYSQKGNEYDIRKEIVERLMQEPHSLQVISEISGILKFYANMIVDKNYYNRYFERYYDKYGDEKLIEYKI